MVVGRIALAILTADLLGSSVLAGDFGSSTLAAGEVRTVRTSLTYRDIRLCNNAGSDGDLVAIIGGNDPVRLTPGMCVQNRGDKFTMRNESTSSVVSTYKVETCTGPH
jgi:hypothetical protein